MMSELTKQETKHYMIFHAVMAFCWITVAVIATVYHDRLTWVFGIAAVAYLVLDELINVFFFWKEYRWRGSNA